MGEPATDGLAAPEGSLDDRPDQGDMVDQAVGLRRQRDELCADEQRNDDEEPRLRALKGGQRQCHALGMPSRNPPGQPPDGLSPEQHERDGRGQSDAHCDEPLQNAVAVELLAEHGNDTTAAARTLFHPLAGNQAGHSPAV
jgi:hypothetical protein